MDRITNPENTPDDRLFTEGDFVLDIPATPLAPGWLNAVQEEICAVAEMDGESLSPDNSGQMRDVIARRATHADVQRGTANRSLNLGTAEAITASFNPPITALSDGLILHVLCSAANTTEAVSFTPNVDSVPNKPLMKSGGNALTAGDIPTGWADLRYDQTMDQWQLLNAPAPVAVAASSSCTVETFTASGTYIKPDGAKAIHLKMISGGGGGASGESMPEGTAAKGGAGGSGGASLEMIIGADYLPSACAVVVGKGGVGAPASDGFIKKASASTDSIFSLGVVAYRVEAGGGAYAQSSPPLRGGMFPGAPGGAGGRDNAGNTSAGYQQITSGGGGGGAVDADGSHFKGGSSLLGALYSYVGSVTNSGGAAGGGNGMDAPVQQVWKQYLFPGIPGGGGGANNAGPGGNGGNAGGYGAGGGGGGGARAPFLSGAGGDGSDGVVVITTFF